MVMPRPTWEETFMSIAETVSKRSTCLRRKVGAVLVKNKHIIATGYNGSPSGFPHCEETGCLREQLNIPSGEQQQWCRSLHAEQNVIIQAALHGSNPQGTELYVTCSPCSICAKMLVNAGIKRVVYQGEYPDQIALQILKDGGVVLENYPVGQNGSR